jgi:hypothetical protein
MLRAIVPPEHIQVMVRNTKVRSTAKVVLVPAFSAFKAQLNSYNKSDAVVFLFDSVFRCQEIKGCHLLDAEAKESSYAFKFRKLTSNDIQKAMAAAAKVKEPVTIVKVDHIPELLKEVKTSILSNILSFLHAAKDVEIREELSEIIYVWFGGQAPVDTLIKKLTKRTQFPKQTLKAFTAAISSEQAANLRAALAQCLSSKTPKVEETAKAFGVEPFELRFCMHKLKPRKSTTREERLAKGKEKAV